MGLMLNKFDSQVSVKIFSDFEVLDFLTIALEALRLLGSHLVSKWYRYKRGKYTLEEY